MAGLLRLAMRGRGMPWLTALGVARQIVERGHSGWSALTPNERSELTRLVRLSRGRPGGLGPTDRDELRRLVMLAGRASARRPHRR